LTKKDFIPIGFGHFVQAAYVLALLAPDSAPIKKMRREAAEKGLLVDATSGRKTRSIILTTTGHLILSAFQPETIAAKLNKKNENNKEGGESFE
jgi:regulator of extracellular matrix RemA (YlzA/DUF370 family)